MFSVLLIRSRNVILDMRNAQKLLFDSLTTLYHRESILVVNNVGLVCDFSGKICFLRPLSSKYCVYKMSVNICMFTSLCLCTKCLNVTMDRKTLYRFPPISLQRYIN